MNVVGVRVPVLLVAVLGGVSAPLSAQWRGAMALEGRAFPGIPLVEGARRYETTMTFSLRRGWNWDRGRQSLTVEPFVRWDPVNAERTRLDFRDLSWQGRWRSWELNAGMREVFWGVAESRHVVDVLNQREFVGGGVGYGKLGQPMVSLAWTRSWGRVEVFLLTGFRERSFAGQAGRLWSPLSVDEARATYESAAKALHLDWAARWTHAIGGWDIGVAHFRGTGREPRFFLDRDSVGRAVWIPHYDLVDRTSVDLQLTTGRWLWKLEGATEAAPAGRYGTIAGGLEYAFADYLSVFAEYVYDSRGSRAATSFQDDVFLGARLFMQAGEISAGAFLDRGTGNRIFNLRAARRLTDAFTVALEVQVFAGAAGREPRHAPRQDSSVGLTLSRYF
jgi:hypothetical protein